MISTKNILVCVHKMTVKASFRTFTGPAVLSVIFLHTPSALPLPLRFMTTLKKVMPLDQYLAEGTLTPVSDYLKEHLHRFGASKPTMQLISEMTGEPFNPDYYIQYLQEKYTKLYSA